MYKSPVRWFEARGGKSLIHGYGLICFTEYRCVHGSTSDRLNLLRTTFSPYKKKFSLSYGTFTCQQLMKRSHSLIYNYGFEHKYNLIEQIPRYASPTRTRLTLALYHCMNTGNITTNLEPRTRLVFHVYVRPLHLGAQSSTQSDPKLVLMLLCIPFHCFHLVPLPFPSLPYSACNGH